MTLEKVIIFLSVFLASLAGLWGLRAINRILVSRRGISPNFEQKEILQHSPSTRKISTISLLFWISVGFIVFKNRSEFDTEGLIAVCIVFGVAILLSLWFFIDSYGEKITLSEDGISSKTIWSKKKYIAWKEVQKVTYSKASGWYEVHGTYGLKIRLSMLLDGKEYVVDAFERYLPDDIQYPTSAEIGFGISDEHSHGK